MRISQIEVENITSLKGNHLINFDLIADQSDLFAITGPTGSGKSTILTAISMALYGEHPKGINAADMVSTGTAKGQIKLTFKKNADTYQIHWTCQTLKKDGTPRKTPLTSRVATKNGDIIEDDISSIIGLTFSQFSKVVILNQGQFSEFLSSSFTQRKDLLEKLLEHHDLKTLAPFLKKKIKEIQGEIDSLEKQGENTLLLSEEQLKEVKNDLKKLKESEAILNEKFVFFKEAKKIVKELVELSNKWQTGTKNLDKENKIVEELIETISLNKKVLTKEKEKLTSLETKIKREAPLIERAKILAQKRDNLKDQEAQIEQKNTKLADKLKKDNLEYDQQEKSIKENKQKAENISKIRKLNSSTERLENTQRVLEESLQHQDKVAQNLENIEFYQGELYKLKEKGETLKAELKEKKELIQKLTQSDEIEEASRLLKDKVSHKEKLQKTLDEHNHQIKGLKEQQQSLSDKLTPLANDNKLLTKELEAQISIVSDLKSKIHLEKSNLELLELLSLGHKHIKNNDCPVCKSSLSDERISELATFLKKESYQERSHLIKELEEKSLEANSRVVELKTRIKSTNDYHTQLTTELEKNTAEQKKVMASIALVKKELEKLGHVDQETLSKVNEATVHFKNIDKNLIELRKSWSEYNTKITELTEKNKELEHKLKKENEKAHQLLDPKDLKVIKLEKLKESLDLIREEIKLTREQAQIISSLEHGSVLLRKIEGAIKETKDNIKALEEDSNQITKELQAIENEFVIKELPRDPKAIEEANNLALDSQRQSFEESRKKVLDSEKLYENKNGQVNFLKEHLSETEGLLKRYILNLSDHIESINSKSETFEDTLSTLNYLKKSIKFDYKDSEQVQALGEFFEDELAEIVLTHEKELGELRREVIVFETRISENEKQQTKLKALHDKKKRLEDSLRELEELGPYLLKDGFRDFALEVLEENLLAMANLEIASLADGRYELVHGKAGKRSELLVRDLWQSNNLRKVSTLSGGETFLLSLGLALGLSEITRGQTEVESFFIDEGFGTLDDESIAQVLGCLMQMQSRGKQIGIISHVKALTEQIPVRIDLEKNNFGESQISIR